MKKIFVYLDYREFLKERFAQLKKTRRATHRSLSQKAGFASPNFLQLVMGGKRNLTEDSTHKAARALGLTEAEVSFFCALVRFNQAKTFAEKDAAYEALRALRRDLPLQHLEHQQLDYFENWYGVAIRELSELHDFREDPAWIAAQLQNKVSIAQVKKTLERLKTLGLLTQDESGKLKSHQQPLSTGNQVVSLLIYKFHEAMLDKAKEALRETDPEHRDFSALTLALSREQFLEIQKKIQAFRKELLAYCQKTDTAQVVYQVNIQFFNLSEVVWKPAALADSSS